MTPGRWDRTTASLFKHDGLRRRQAQVVRRVVGKHAGKRTGNPARVQLPAMRSCADPTSPAAQDRLGWAVCDSWAGLCACGLAKGRTCALRRSALAGCWLLAAPAAAAAAAAAGSTICCFRQKPILKTNTSSKQNRFAMLNHKFVLFIFQQLVQRYSYNCNISKNVTLCSTRGCRIMPPHYAAARYRYAELCRIMLLCRLCRTHAIMPIYYAGIKGHAQYDRRRIYLELQPSSRG
eukprot:COSAG01_NODE_5638_length_4125_cov_33.364382_3_plen_235_part_00